MKKNLIPLLLLLVWPSFLFADAGGKGSVENSTITFVTWNIEHLASKNNVGCRPRNDADYRALEKFVKSFKADIIAFQEVENMEAARRVFNPLVFKVEISNRPGVKLGGCYNNDEQRRMQRTGFAVRRDFEDKYGWTVKRMPDVRQLACYPTQRWGVHLMLTPMHKKTAMEKSGIGPLHLLCVHLQSGCFFDPVVYKNDTSPCSRLAEQVPRLEAWIDARAAAKEEFMVMGDMNRQLDGLSDPVWTAIDDSEICGWVMPSSGFWHCEKGTIRYSRFADLERARTGLKHPYPRNPKYPYSIDHMIMSPGADQMSIEKSAVFVRDKQKLSDHTPLLMKLVLP